MLAAISCLAFGENCWTTYGSSKLSNNNRCCHIIGLSQFLSARVSTSPSIIVCDRLSVCNLQRCFDAAFSTAPDTKNYLT